MVEGDLSSRASNLFTEDAIIPGMRVPSKVYEYSLKRDNTWSALFAPDIEGPFNDTKSYHFLVSDEDNSTVLRFLEEEEGFEHKGNSIRETVYLVLQNLLTTSLSADETHDEVFAMAVILDRKAGDIYIKYGHSPPME